MDSLQAREFLMIPGPTPVPEVVLEAIAKHPIGHRTPEFSKTVTNVTERLKRLGETTNDVFVLTGSGTSAMEAAICNTINAGDSVLSLVCGNFGERWAKIAEAFGAQVQRLTVESGKSIDVHALESALKQDTGKQIKAVTITHNETSTGVMNDLSKIASLVRAHGALSIVDAVTSFAAVKLPIDEWQVDILVTGSQKALMLPPGLGIIFFGKRAWEAQSRCTTPRFYLDLAKARKSLAENTTPFTPNVSLFTGLSVSLDLIEQTGVENVFQRHIKLKEALRAGLKAMGLKLFVAEEDASPTITSILPPDSISVADIRKGLKQDYRILVADGQEALKGKIFRIGHMGYVFERDILMTLASLESVLKSLGHECTTGKAAQAAIGALSR